MAVSSERVDRLLARLGSEAAAGGYQLNPDGDFARDLVEGMLVNEDRYGYPSCPCRLASGEKAEDLDIVCPCDYRDPDLSEHGACYCALYVSRDVIAGKTAPASIPDRRPPRDERNRVMAPPSGNSLSALPFPVWRCRVCGYLCAREEPPEVCPVCKAKKERFERFL